MVNHEAEIAKTSLQAKQELKTLVVDGAMFSGAETLTTGFYPLVMPQNVQLMTNIDGLDKLDMSTVKSLTLDRQNLEQFGVFGRSLTAIESLSFPIKDNVKAAHGFAQFLPAGKILQLLEIEVQSGLSKAALTGLYERAIAIAVNLKLTFKVSTHFKTEFLQPAGFELTGQTVLWVETVKQWT